MKKILAVLPIVAILVIAGYAIADSGYGYGGSASPTGGSGVITKEPLNNVKISETIKMYMIGGEPTVYSFKNPEFAIYQVVIVGKEDEEDVAVRIESLKGPSVLTRGNVPEALIYTSENVWAGTDKISDVTIRFRVENSWIDDNNVDRNDIRLVKYDIKDESWKQLETLQIDEDDKYTYFESKSFGLSVFVITGMKEVQILPTETRPSETGETGEVVTTEIGETPGAAQTTVPGFEIVVAGAVVSIAYAMTRKRR